MATDQSTVDFLLEQLQKAGEMRARKMFGEYALYCNDKVVALVCDDALFMKRTEIVNEFLDDSYIAPPFPGAKNYYRVPEDKWDDAEWLTEFVQKTAELLPLPKRKRK